ncbi:MAG: hypothetical protein PVI90_09240 [Desulfobacteraceae bacterium]|jgi:hypothetical protein
MNMPTNPGYFIVAEILGAPASSSFYIEVVTKEGNILIPSQELIEAGSSPSAISANGIPIYNNELVSVSVRAVSGLTVPHGLRCSLYLARGPLASSEKRALLAEGYITHRNGFFWPGSANSGAPHSHSTVQIAEWPQTEPYELQLEAGDNEFLIVRSAGHKYQASVTSGSRYMRLYISDGTNTIQSIQATTGQVQSTTRYYTYGQYFPGEEYSASARNNYPVPFPWVPPGHVFGMIADGGKSNDVITLANVIFERYSI